MQINHINTVRRLLVATLFSVSALWPFLDAQAAEQEPGARDNQSIVGHVYMQTNTIDNEILHYGRQSDGKLILIEKIGTKGSGSGEYKPISGQKSAPNAFEGAGSVILSPDHRFLFTTNGGNNSVTSFRIEKNGRLKFLDVQSTGETVVGKSGTAKSLAYAVGSQTLYVLHAFGPKHIRTFSVKDGKLALRKEAYTVNTEDKTDRIPTQIVLSPDQKFLLIDILFDSRPAENPDGTPNLVVANASDRDGLVVFPVHRDGTLDKPSFNDAGGAGPFYIAFLNSKPDTFVNGLAVGDGIVLSRIDSKGKITNSSVVAINTSAGKPSELCWLAVSSDDTKIFATNFGYGNVTSFNLANGMLQVARDPASPVVPGDGTFRAVNGLVSSGPSDSWMSPDDKFFYQIYGNASALIGYRVGSGGDLTENGRYLIPYNSPQGLAGF